MNSKPEGSDTGGGPNQDPPGYTFSSDHGARTNRQNGRQGRVTDSAIAAEKACRIAIERIEQDLGIWNHLGVVVNWLLGAYGSSWGSS